MKMGQRVTPSGVLVAPSTLPEAEWLKLRQEGIGGSDIAALLGLNKYSSPRELYLEKRGELPDFPRPEALERAAMWGHLHEPLLAARFADMHGLRVRRIGLIRHEAHEWMLANLDRQVHGCPDGPCPLEIKNRSAYKASEWGTSGDPEGVPDIEALQTQWYIHVTGYTHAHVAVLINGNDDRYYRVERDSELITDVVAIAAGFWQRVLRGNPPPIDGSDSALELLDGLWEGREGATRVVDPTLVNGLKARRAGLLTQRDDLATAVAEIENELRDLLGDAENAVSDGQRLYTWRRNGNFATKKFKTAHPDLAEKYTHLVPAIDTAALAADRPDLYRAFRARVLRIPQESSQ